LHRCKGWCDGEALDVFRAKDPFSRLVIGASTMGRRTRRSRGRGLAAALRDIASPERQQRVLEAFAGVTGGRRERHAGLVSSLRGYR
jgi:hypothetical protein